MDTHVVSSTRVNARRVQDLPGPAPWPLLGNLLQIQRDRMHLQLEAWAQQYGDVFRFRLANRRFVAFANHDAIASILRDRPDVFRRTSRLEQTAREFGFNGLFSSNGDDWRRQRPMVLSGLDPTHVRSFFPTLVKVTDRLACRWQAASDRGEPIDLQSDLMRYTVDVTAGLAFGVDINTLESREEVIQQHLDKVFPQLFRRLLAPFPYWRVVKLPTDRAFDRHLVALHRAVSDFIQGARRSLEAHPERRMEPTNLVEALVAARDRDGSRLNDDDVSGNILTLLLAGEDTTANTLGWLTWLLKRNPAALARAEAEVLAAAAPDRAPRNLKAHTDLARLEYVEACANEAMRLRPVAPINVLEAACDTVVGGVAVPKGALVVCLMRPAAVDARHFPDPEAFRPERWTGSDAQAESSSSPKRISMPFGAGPRMCPGRYLAIAEIKIVTAMLLANFEIDSVTTRDGREVRERLAFAMSPVGLTMRLRRRGERPAPGRPA